MCDGHAKHMFAVGILDYFLPSEQLDDLYSVLSTFFVHQNLEHPNRPTLKPDENFWINDYITSVCKFNAAYGTL